MKKILLIIIAIVLLGSSFFFVPRASADEFDDFLSAIQSDNYQAYLSIYLDSNNKLFWKSDITVGGLGGSFFGLTGTDFAVLSGSAIYSGILFNDNSAVFSRNIVFENFRAALYGGAIHSADSSLNFSGANIRFSSNSAKDNNGAWGLGGAFYAVSNINYAPKLIDFSNAIVHFSSNNAGSGGAVYASFSTFAFTGATVYFSSNAAFGSDKGGGAILAENKSIINFYGATVYFSSNAAYDGGAVHLNNSKIDFSGAWTEFVGNRAAGRGGAIYAIASTIVFSASDPILFLDNKSLSQEGADIFLDGSFLTLEVAGASIKMLGGIKAVSGSQFSYLNPTQSGGFLYLSGINIFDAMSAFDLSAASKIEIASAVFSYQASKHIELIDNSAVNFYASTASFRNNVGSDGGALFLSSSTIKFIKSSASFNANSAVSSGGAVFVYKSTVEFQNSIIYAFGNNAPNGYGGAFYLEYSQVDISNSYADFYENRFKNVLNDFYLSNSTLTLINSRLFLKSGIQSFLGSEINADNSRIMLSSINIISGAGYFNLSHSSLTVLKASFLYEQNDFAFNLSHSSAHFSLSIASFGANGQEGGAILSASIFSAHLSSLAFFGAGDFLENSALKLKDSFLLFNGRVFFDDAIVFEIFHSSVLIKNSSFTYVQAQKTAMNLENSRLSFVLSSVSYADNIRLSDRGGGVLDAKNSLISITSSNVHFLNNKAELLGQGGYGGIFYLEKSEVNFISGSVHITSAHSARSGGAFYLDKSTINFIQAAVFASSNIAISSGGVFYISADKVGFKDGSGDFSFNKALDGGVFYAGIAELSFENTKISFMGNSASGRGGALFLNNSAVSISASADIVFSGNEAAGKPNDIFMTNSKLNLQANQFQIRLEGGIEAKASSFSYSNAAGGNLFLSGINKFEAMALFDIAAFSSISVLNADFQFLNSNLANINLSNSQMSFLSSTASFKDIKTKGALILDRSKVVFENAEIDFSSNSTNLGGALKAINSSSAGFASSNILFSSNVSLGLLVSDGGGAIFSASKSSVNFTNSWIFFEVNDAKTRGGAVFADDNSTVHFLKSTSVFLSNKAALGGALMVRYTSTISFTGSSIAFINNSATSLGGAILSSGNASALNFLDSDVFFEGNKKTGAGQGGGALAATDGAIISFLNSRLELKNNQSGSFGGAVFAAQGAIIKFENVEMKAEGNTSISSGAAFYIASNSSISLIAQNSDIVFSANKAFGKPNDVYIDNAKLYLISYGRQIKMEGGIISTNTAQTIYKSIGGSLYLSGINDFINSALEFAQESSITVANASFTFRNSSLPLLLNKSTINFLSSRVSFHDNGRNISLSSSRFSAQHSILNFQNGLDASKSSITISGGYLASNGQSHFEMMNGFDLHISSAAIENAVWKYIDSAPMTLRASTMVFSGALTSLTFSHSNARNNDLVFSANAQMIFNVGSNQEARLSNGIRSIGEGSITKTGLGIIVFIGSNTRMMNSAFVLRQGTAVFMSAKSTITALFMSTRTALEMRSSAFLSEGASLRNEIAIHSPFISSGIFFGFDVHFSTDKPSWADFLNVHGELTFAWTSTVTAKLDAFNDNMRVMGTSVAFMGAESDPDISNLWLILEGGSAGDENKFSMIVGSRRIWLVYIGGWNAFVRAYKLAGNGGNVSLLKDIKAGDDENPPLPFSPNNRENNLTVFGGSFTVNSDGVLDLGFDFYLSSAAFRDISFTSFTRSSGAVMIVNRSTIIFTRQISFFNNSAVSSGAVVFADIGANVRFINARASFDSNKAGGGVIYAQGANIVFSSGAVHFTSNSAQLGGAIFADKNSDVRFSSGAVYFTSNSAVLGGAIFARETGIHFASGTVRFSSNSANLGGAIYLINADMRFINGEPNFIGNIAQSSGAAILARNSSLFIENPLFSDNRAFNRPNDVFIDNSRLDISAKRKMAQFLGGIIAVNNSEISFVHTNRNGEALYLSGINKFENIAAFNMLERSSIIVEAGYFEYRNNNKPLALSANSALIFRHSTVAFTDNFDGALALMSRSKVSFEFSQAQILGGIEAYQSSILSFDFSQAHISEIIAQGGSITFKDSYLFLSGYESGLRQMRNFDLNNSSSVINSLKFNYEGRNFDLKQSFLAFNDSDISFENTPVRLEHSTINIVGSNSNISFNNAPISLDAALLYLQTQGYASLSGIKAINHSVVEIDADLDLIGKNYFDDIVLIFGQGGRINISGGFADSFEYKNNGPLLLDGLEAVSFSVMSASWTNNAQGAININNSDFRFMGGRAYFVGNSAELGGAIFKQSANDEMLFIDAQTLFTNNAAISSGAAVYQMQGAQIGFEGGWIGFVDNLSNFSGGAAYLDNSSMVFTNASVEFDANNAGGGGGAIYAIGRSYVFIGGEKHSVFSGNRAIGLGGAIYAENSFITVSNADFMRNTAGGIANDVYLKDGSELTFIVSDNVEVLMEGGIISDDKNTVFKRGGGSLKFSNQALVLLLGGIVNIEQGMVKFGIGQSTISEVNIFSGAALGITNNLRNSSLLYFSTITIAHGANLLVDTIRPVSSTGITIDFLFVDYKRAGDLFENKNIFAGEYQYSFNWRDNPDGGWIGYLKYLGSPIWQSSHSVNIINGAFYADLMSLAARTNFNFDVLDKTKRVDSLWIIGAAAGETLGTESENPFETQNSGIKIGIDLISDGGIFMGYGRIQAQNAIRTADGGDIELGFYKVWRGQDVKVNMMMSGALTEINTDDSFHIKSQAARLVLEIEKAAWGDESWRLGPFIGVHGGYAMIEKTSLRTDSWQYPANPQDLLMAEFPPDRKSLAVLELPAFNWMRLKTFGGVKFEFRTVELLRISLKAYGGTIALGNRPKFKSPQIEIEGTSEGDFFAGAGLAFEYQMTSKASLIMGGNFEMSDTGRAFSANFGASFKIGALRGDTWGHEEKPIVKEKPKKKPKKPKKEPSKDDESKKQEQEKANETEPAQMQTIERTGGIALSSQTKLIERGDRVRTSSHTSTIERTKGIGISSQTRTGQTPVAAGDTPFGQTPVAVGDTPFEKGAGAVGDEGAGAGNIAVKEAKAPNAQPQIKIVINEMNSGGGIIQNNRRIFRIYPSDFISSSDKLTAKGRAEIKRIAGIIVRDGYGRIVVEGHTDAAGDGGINLVLQKDRTHIVIEELQALGIPAGDLEYLWIGSRVPIASDKTPAGRNMNRRIEIRVE